MEADYEEKLDCFVNAVLKHRVDVIALQEIMQPIDGKPSNFPCLNSGYIPLKQGNHAVNIAKALYDKGEKYSLAWLGFKKSYDKFDEGIAILTKHSIEKAKSINLTALDDYESWRTRKALGVQVNNEWFFSVHMGWWDSFEYEFEQLKKNLPQNKRYWLMGDFNSPASEREKGYDLIISSGLYDTYTLAKNKDEGYTANTKIDGWKKESDKKIRIDYIFTNKMSEIESSFVIFNGSNENVVSDHFGIIVNVEEQ